MSGTEGYYLVCLKDTVYTHTKIVSTDSKVLISAPRHLTYRMDEDYLYEREDLIFVLKTNDKLIFSHYRVTDQP